VRRLALAGAAAAALALAGGASAATRPPVRAGTDVTPRAVLFGDTVTAVVRAVVDPKRADPASLRVSGDFAPYRPEAPATRTVHVVGGVAYVRLTLPLECWTSSCLVNPKRHRLVFHAARLEYRLEGGGSGSLRLGWPAIDRYTRLDPVVLSHANPQSVPPWHGDPTALPRVTYAIDPGLLRWLLVGGGIALLVVGALLAARLVPGWRLSPRRRPALTPLERALLILETAWAQSAAEQRKALELLAAELESAGEPPLADAARELAWSRSTPAPDTTETLATRVRGLIGSRSNASAS
jgi:hypothetical protein